MAKRKSTNRSRTRPSSASSAAKAGRKSALSVKSDNKKKKPTPRSKTASSRRRAEKIDALKPKKPPTAFFYFLEDFRKGYQEQNPDVKSMRDIGKACGEKWNTMTYEEKVQYYDIATEKRAEFDAAMAEFMRRKESGELGEEDDSELENDSEFDDDSDFDG